MLGYRRGWMEQQVTTYRENTFSTDLKSDAFVETISAHTYMAYTHPGTHMAYIYRHTHMIFTHIGIHMTYTHPHTHMAYTHTGKHTSTHREVDYLVAAG